MNEFTKILHEAFAGLEPYDPAPGRAALEEAIQGFERRDRSLRTLVWGSVALLTVLAVYSAWRLVTADDADARELVLSAVLFLFAIQGIGWQKMFLFSSQRSLRIEVELKRVQLMLSERE
jgi:hypothetical protein